MAERDPQRLKSYFDLITRRRGGAAAVLEQLEAISAAQAFRPGIPGSGQGGLESAGGQPSLSAMRDGLETVDRGAVPQGEPAFGLEAIIYADLRPAMDVVGGRFTVAHPMWGHLNDPPTRAHIERAIPSVGRIELPGNRRVPYGGTGFIVGDGLVMTNRHVAELFASGLGDRSIRFNAGAQAGVDFLRERDPPTGPVLQVRRVRMVHPYWDMALMEVEGLGAREPLRLSVLDARDLAGREIFVVGYPAFDPRNPSDAQQQVFGTAYGIKRLQPGMLHGGMTTSSFGKQVMAATHDCSTLGGNSGSAVVDLQTGEVLALHFGGVYQEQNFCVPSHALSLDGRIVDAGVQFAGGPAGGPNEWGAWWTQADTERPMQSTAQPAPGSAPAAVRAPAAPDTPATLDIIVPVRIRIEVGAAQPAAPVPAAGLIAGLASAATERVVAPAHNAAYDGRSGYEADFLGVGPVPMPDALDPSVLAPVASGGTTLLYQNFSIRMHKRRRLALVCASNVTGALALRHPEPGRDYTRAGLGGLGPHDTELWFPDPRLDAQHQLPDVFFTRDHGMFDKGHLVRREDVAWGGTYEAVRRANGDTFHVTNCSPQLAGFNRSNLGEQNWGDLENAVLSAAASERLCVLAGPILDKHDPLVIGAGENGTTLRVQVPTRFWKVVAAQHGDGIAAFGFVLEQYLPDMAEAEEPGAAGLEFAVPGEFQAFLVPLAEIGQAAGVSFAPSLLRADQAAAPLGPHIAARAGAKIRVRLRGH